MVLVLFGVFGFVAFEVFLCFFLGGGKAFVGFKDVMGYWCLCVFWCLRVLFGFCCLCLRTIVFKCD